MQLIEWESAKEQAKLTHLSPFTPTKTHTQFQPVANGRGSPKRHSKLEMERLLEIAFGSHELDNSERR